MQNSLNLFRHWGLGTIVGTFQS